MPQSGNVTPVRYDLIQYARVTQVISNTVFISDDLAGFLSDTFIGYSVWVLTKTDGTITAPRGEDPKLISIFEGNGTGQVTHAAFTANLAVGDEVLILHPSVANATTMAALIGTIITSLVNLPDGVYLDTISGFAGTAWPIGSPGRPALTLADALTIAAARNLSKLYLVGDGAHTLTLTNGFSMRIEGNPEYAITIPALATVLIESDLVCGQLTNNGSVQVDGDLTTNIMENLGAGGIYIDGNAKTTAITNSAGGDITIIGTLDCTGGFDNTGGDDIGITGDTFIGGTLTLSGASDLTIYGNTHVSAINCGTTGVVAFHGSAQINGAFTNTTTATIVVDGDFEAGTNLDLTGSTSFTVRLNVQIGGTLTNTTGSVAINGNTQIGEDLLISGAGNLVFDGNLIVSDDITLSSTGDLTVNGDLRADAISISNAGAQLNVYGDIRCTSITCSAGSQILADNFFCSGVADFTAVSTITIVGNLESGGTMTFTAAASIYGKVTLHYGANIAISSGILTVGSIDVLAGGIAISTGGLSCKGDCFVGAGGGITQTGTGDVYIYGNCKLSGTWSIQNTGASIQVTGDITCNAFTSTANGGISCYNFFCAGDVNFTSMGAPSVSIKGDLYSMGNLTLTTNSSVVYGKFYIRGNVICNTGAGGASLQISGEAFIGNSLTWASSNTLYFFDDATIAVNFTSSGTNDAVAYGNFTCNGDFLVSSSGGLTVRGNMYVKGTTTISAATGSLIVYGNAHLVGAVGATHATATITITGIAEIYGAITATGTVTYKGKHPEVAVSFNATDVAAEFFHLAAATGTQYNVSKIRFKCADPGAQTVTVSLEEYVNGVLTVVDTFTINTGNYATYFSLMDMFGVDHLSGDELRISAVASDAGPYAVTGSYVYSNH